jgi:hypothetical protein
MAEEGEKQRLIVNAQPVAARPFSVVLRPVGAVFVTGLSSAYDDAFPRELHGVLDEGEFHKAIRHVNRILTDYWPCPACYWFGLGCCLCSAGLSLCAPHHCIREVREEAPAD